MMIRAGLGLGPGTKPRVNKERANKIILHVAINYFLFRTDLIFVRITV